MTTFEFETAALDETALSFVEGTNEVRKAIIEIGCAVYDHTHLFVSVSNTDNDGIKHDLQNQIKTLIDEREQYVHNQLDSKNKDIERLKRNLDEIEEQHNKRLKTERDYYETTIDTLKKNQDAHTETIVKPKIDEIMYLKALLDTHKTDHDKQKQEELQRLEDSHDKYVRSLFGQIQQLQTMVDAQSQQLKEHENKKHINVVRMGQIGESSVEQYVCNHFTEGKITNTAKTGGQGDLHFHYKEMDALLEVKNKDRITPEDVSKFERDVAETDCVGGVFISIKPSVNVPCHSAYDVEWVKGKPVMYIVNFETLPDMLYVALKTVFHYHQMCNSVKRENDDEFAKCKQQLAFVTETIKLFKPLLEDASNSIKRSQDSVLNMQNILKNQLKEFVADDLCNHKENKMAFVIHTCSDFSDRNNRLPTYDELCRMPNISKKDLSEIGGMTAIRSEFKKRQTK